MTVQAVVIGISESPAEIEPMRHDSEVWIRLGHLSLYVRAADIERLSTALDQAREVLKASASKSEDKE
ncbi:hypothetical protein [Actinoplanes solisilvae]|uniref:hypothetical protein n=1 Tax=Actinoplanes solisilvae TaxID=2486853 RepID=UPI000FDC2C37|nr:hypothetical protein [Actinoplanes solisilvae]